MIQDSASHGALKIGELTRVIPGYLVSINQESAVNLACACRYLEEPVLSTLWETQPFLHPLLMMLPEDTWGQWGNADYTRIEVRDPNLPLGRSNAQVYAASVEDREGSTIGGLG